MILLDNMTRADARGRRHNVYRAEPRPGGQPEWVHDVETGVDRISTALSPRDVRALDLSLRHAERWSARSRMAASTSRPVLPCRRPCPTGPWCRPATAGCARRARLLDGRAADHHPPRPGSRSSPPITPRDARGNWLVNNGPQRVYVEPPRRR